MATIILDVNGLQAMENDLTEDYELGNDIQCGVTKYWNSGEGFDPIGKSGSPYFTGSFDGKGYTINDLFINRPNEYGIGLFGYSAGVISNVGLVDCDITGGSIEVGALVGYQYNGSVTSCYSTGTVAVTGDGISDIGGLIGVNLYPITDCYSTCTVTASDTDNGGAIDVGGLIGACSSSANAVVTRCYATGNVTATSANAEVAEVGGLVGDIIGGTFSKCYATGNVTVTAATTGEDIGGFVGISFGKLDDCYARGDLAITVGDTSLGSIGGFVGYMQDYDFDNCYSTGRITETGGMPHVGGFCGWDPYDRINNSFWDTQTSGTVFSDGGTGKTTAQMKTESTFTDAGWDIPDTWYLVDSYNDNYPFFPPTGLGHIWVEGNYLHFVHEKEEQTLLGTLTGDTGVAGHLFSEGTALHYIDSSGRERSQGGYDTSANATGGTLWIEDRRLHYIDENGDERQLGSWVLGHSKLAVDAILGSW